MSNLCLRTLIVFHYRVCLFRVEIIARHIADDAFSFEEERAMVSETVMVNGDFNAVMLTYIAQYGDIEIRTLRPQAKLVRLERTFQTQRPLEHSTQDIRNQPAFTVAVHTFY